MLVGVVVVSRCADARTQSDGGLFGVQTIRPPNAPLLMILIAIRYVLYNKNTIPYSTAINAGTERHNPDWMTELSVRKP